MLTGNATPTFTLTDHMLGSSSRGTRNGRATSSIVANTGRMLYSFLPSILRASFSRPCTIELVKSTRGTMPGSSPDISSSSKRSSAV